jgi:hypothetical protein
MVTVFPVPVVVTPPAPAAGLAGFSDVLTGGPGSGIFWGSLAALAFLVYSFPDFLDQSRRRR